MNPWPQVNEVTVTQNRANCMLVINLTTVLEIALVDVAVDMQRADEIGSLPLMYD